MNTRRNTLVTAVLVLMALGIAGHAAAQSTGRLVGKVADTTQGVLPGATVTVAEVNTGSRRDTVTNERGEYLVNGLPRGVYEVTVEMPGFQKAVVAGVEVHAGGQVRVDAVLKVAGLTDSVVVEARHALVETERGSLENRVLAEQIADMPLNTRNPLELLTLATGVASVNAGIAGEEGIIAYQVSGSRDGAVNYKVEGNTSENLIDNRAAAVPPIDSVAEFTVKSGVATADSGLGGAQVEVAIRSGTNELRGSLYDFFRGNVLDARNFFTPVDAKKGHLMKNQVGGSLGGPIFKNRTFFFTNVEYRRSRTDKVSLATVPTLEERRGDFRNSGITVLDPFNGRQPFPGNVIPANRFNAASLKLLSYLPEPNLPGVANNYFANLPERDDETLVTVRLDHNLSSKQRLSWLVRWRTRDAFLAGDVPGLGGQIFDDGSHAQTVRHDYIISSRWLNQFSFAWLKDESDVLNELHRDIVSELGFAKTLGSTLPEAQYGFPDLYLRGLFRFVELGRNPSVNLTETFSLKNDVSYSRGNHAIRFGAEALRARISMSSVERQRPVFEFRNFHTGSVMGDFLLGMPYNILIDVGAGVPEMRRSYFAGYLMDDWRVTPRLTLNLGLRYEFYTVPIEINDRLSAYDFSTGGLVVSSKDGKLPQGMLPLYVSASSPIPIRTNQQAGLPRGLRTADTNNFMPRVDMAYRLTENSSTIVRGGYGWFYAPLRLRLPLIGSSRNPPFIMRPSVNNNNHNNPLLFDQVADLVGAVSQPPASQLIGVQSDFEDALSQQWAMSLERLLGASTAVRLSYVGNRGSHLPVRLNYNQPKLVSGAGGVPTLVTLDPKFAAIDVLSSAARSSYHAGELEVRRRLAGGLSLQANWTWAKLLSQAERDNLRPQDSYDLEAEWADASFQRRHVFNVNFVYELPVGPGKRWLQQGALSHILGGWRCTGIARVMTGLRYSPRYSTVDPDIDIRSGRPDLTGDPNSGLHSPQQWFNTSAFSLPMASGPASFRFGNSARNLVVGPGYRSLDLGLQKQVKAGRSGTMTVRIEAYNALNNTNFDGNSLDTDLVSVAAGSLSQAFAPRQFQFSVRFSF
ncbi:MAG: TonB-dependent receptor [Acidobacteria bacterium]|nr:TonB-dependent receptor [Acidobacteriota bacterium]